MPSPYYASVILSLASVVDESLSFSTLQKMQRWLRSDSNTRLEATYLLIVTRVELSDSSEALPNAQPRDRLSERQQNGYKPRSAIGLFKLLTS